MFVFPQPMIAGLESLLIFLVFIVGSALMTWLKNRGGKEDDWSEMDRPGPRPARTEKKARWEEELRRMLEDPEEPAHTPPPLVRRATPPPLPPRPVIQSAPLPQPERSLRPPPPVFTHTPVEEPEGEETVVHSHLAPLSQSNAALWRAGQLEQLVASHFKDITLHHVQNTATLHNTVRSPQVEQVVRWFRSPNTVRQVLIASVILGPPKALQ